MNSSIKYFDNKKPVNVIKDGQINRIKASRKPPSLVEGVIQYLFLGVFS